MRAALVVTMLAVVSMPGLARAQADADAPIEIPIHASVTTVLHLPDEVERARFNVPVTGLVRATTLENKVMIRAGRRARAGTEVRLEVMTATMRQRFRLRVVRHAGDAWRAVMVVRPGAQPDAEEGEQDVEDGAQQPPAPPAAGAPDAPASAPLPAAPAPAAPGDDTAPERARPAPTTLHPRRFELSVHAVAALPGFTAFEIPGYAPDTARQLHGAFGLRLAVERPGAWWALETTISAELPAGPMIYERKSIARLEVSGPWLHAEMGMRARLEMRWTPSLYAAFGGQVHLRRSVETRAEQDPEIIDTMEDGLALVLGTGLHHRVGDVVLGLDFQVRRGAPDDYLSVTTFWSIGYVLDQGE